MSSPTDTSRPCPDGARRADPSALRLRADAIVVAYRSREVLADCARSLRRDPAVGRIIVVNNSPGDGVEAVLEGIPAVIFRESPANVGFGRAINAVRGCVEAPYVVLANPDTRQEDATVSAALDFLALKPRAALMGPRMVTADGRLDRNSKHSMGLIRMLTERLRGPKAFRAARSRADHMRAHASDYVIGSFVVCRREALDAVDWFDEQIFLFGEDQDLCRRLRAAGWEVWFAPVGRVVHWSGHSWRQLSDQGQAHFRNSRRRELRKDSGSVVAGLYAALERLSRACARRPRDPA
jgi:N-acetylglucosaminyl-diphospho-decaprenol L-rhamnosyltransferase